MPVRLFTDAPAFVFGPHMPLGDLPSTYHTTDPSLQSAQQRHTLRGELVALRPLQLQVA